MLKPATIRRLARTPGAFEIIVGLGAFVTFMYAIPVIFLGQ